MHETRRKFVMAMAALCTAWAAPVLPKAPQKRSPMPEPPEPAQTQNPDRGNAQASQQRARKAVLRQNEREFRDGVERLYQLASDLRDEVQKTSTTEVLSVRMYKKTEEIEKLAKQLKSKARG